MDAKQPRSETAELAQLVTIIIDERPTDGLIGLFVYPVQCGGVVNFWSELQNTTVDFYEGSPLEGPNPVVVPQGCEEPLSVPVKKDAALKTYPCEFKADGLQAPRKMQVVISNYGQVENGFTVSESGIVLMIPAALADGAKKVAVRFQNVTPREITLTINKSESLVAVPPSETDLRSFEPKNGMVSVVVGSLDFPESGGTQQADIYIEPPP